MVGRAAQGGAEQGNVGQDMAGWGRAAMSRAGQGGTDWGMGMAWYGQSNTAQGRAGHGASRARQRGARQGRTRHAKRMGMGRTRQARVGQDREWAGQGNGVWATQSRTGQGKPLQDRTHQQGGTNNHRQLVTAKSGL